MPAPAAIPAHFAVFVRISLSTRVRMEFIRSVVVVRKWFTRSLAFVRSAVARSLAVVRSSLARRLAADISSLFLSMN